MVALANYIFISTNITSISLVISLVNTQTTNDTITCTDEDEQTCTKAAILINKRKYTHG